MVVSALMFALLASPVASSAHSNGNQGNGNAKAKVELQGKAKSNNSFWSRIFGGFFGNRAKAAPIRGTSSTPNISGVTAPTVLRTGETGTWTVRASDPQNGSLTYAVDWGDAKIQPSSAAARAFVQTSTFSHAYDTAGTYTVKFTVSNNQGLSTTSTATVNVVGRNVTQPNTPVIKSIDAPKEVTVGATATVKVNAYDPKNRALSYSVDWGDTAMTTDTALMARRAPVFVQSATFDHIYTEAGTYKATFTVENSAGKKTSSSVEIHVSQPIR